MMKRLGYICVILAIATLSSCCSCRGYQKRTQRPLENTQWHLVQLMGQQVTTNPNKLHITFLKDNKIVGVGACNSIRAQYTVNDNRSIKIEHVTSTRMMCPDMTLEQQFTSALESTTHYEMDGPNLLLLTNGELRAVLEAKPID